MTLDSLSTGFVWLAAFLSLVTAGMFIGVGLTIPRLHRLAVAVSVVTAVVIAVALAHLV